ncbi:hypothetical protein [Deinococcus navajonensis]|uniref:Toprim domain-containing protein n=1 Tax=Deinococcus navajonensis TaxID=309884 RepID=A0ABV8XQZ9_9DEIO
MKLPDLLDLVPLPDLIANTCGPDAVRGLNRDHGGVIPDPRPGHEERHPSFSVYCRNGRWRFKRHGGDGASGSAYDFLLSLNYTPGQAREELARLAGVSLEAWLPGGRPSVPAPDPLRAARWALEKCRPFSGEEQQRLPGLLDFLSLSDAAGRDLQRRGLYGYAGLQVGRLRRDFSSRDGRMLAHAGALGILVRGPDGRPYALKVRNLGTVEALEASGLHRYVYRLAGHGAPAWCSPRYGHGEAVLIVEGELNGAAATRALREVGLALDVQGLAGAGGTPFLDGLAGKPVFLYADPDDAGAACLDRVGELALKAGAREVRVLPGLPEGDLCDLLGTLGPVPLGDLLGDWCSQADYWQKSITGKNGLPVNGAVQHAKNDYWQTGNHTPGWGTSDTSGWASEDGPWGVIDRGGW